MSLPTLIDLIIIIFCALYLIDGYRRGFLLLLVEFIGTFLAFGLAALWANWAGQLLNHYVSFPSALQKPIGFLVLWFVIQALYGPLVNLLYPLIPTPVRESLINRLGGLIPSLAKAIVLAAITLTLVVALPIDTPIRAAIASSHLGEPLVHKTQEIQQALIDRYSQQFSDALSFLVSSPLIPHTEQEGESLALHFTTTKVSVDTASEATMLNLVNQERTSRGLKPLIPNTKLQAVARDHAKDMFARGYFSHNTPEGLDPFDRMHQAGITFLTAGENLALAPTVQLAHTGLMNSPKHKENILDPDFGHVGIGVIDGGIYGRMFVQEFTN